MFPTKFQLNLTYRSRANVVSRFSSWPLWWPSWILEQKLAILNLHVTPMPPTKFSLNPNYPSGAEMVWRFSRQPACGAIYLRYGTRTTLAILNLYVASMPPTKFQLNLTYGLGGDVVWRFSRWPTWRPSWISEWNAFSYPRSPYGPNASHQVWAQSD